ncbi:hypothetical protein AN644_00225 [Candidatus Epulonipiscium fishelsonii]|nr:hypothetical protein AN644_00225 [Epulopiscium sp. SCG-C06WGA-EpuloA1]
MSFLRDIDIKLSYREQLLEEIKMLKEEVEEIDNEIKESLCDDEGLITNNYEVIYRTQSKYIIDIDKLKEECFYDSFLKKSVSKYYKVKKIGDKKNG